MNGRVLVSPVKTDGWFPSATGPSNRIPKSNVGKVRVGYVDVLGGPVRFRFVSLAPAFDPDADSMVPVRDLGKVA